MRRVSAGNFLVAAESRIHSTGDVLGRWQCRPVQRSNEDAGGSVIEIAGHEHVIRGRGYVRTTHDLEQVPLRATTGGVPVRVRDVGEVAIGQDIRHGVAELDGEGEVAGGVVIMRYGENALDVIDGVKQRLAEIQRSLPDGVTIQVTYDRSELISARRSSRAPPIASGPS